MLKRLAIPFACLLTGLLTGYLLGLKSSRKPSAQAVAASTQPDRAPNLKLAAAKADGRSETATDDQDEASPSFLDSVNKLAEKYDARISDQLAHSLTLEQIQQALQHLSGIDKTSANHLRADLFRAWAAKDPQAAWKAAFPLTASQGRIQALAAIASELAKTNPQAAIDLAMSLARGNARDQSLKAAFTEWASNDFHAALAYYNQHSDLPFTPYAFTNALNKISEQNPLRALELSLALPGFFARSQMQDELVLKLYKKDAQAAIGWVMNQHDPLTQRGALHSLLRAMAKDDPRKALEFLHASAFPGERSSAEASIFSVWLEKDLNAALDYLASNPALREREKSSYHWQIINALNTSTPAEQKKLLNRLPDDDFKFRLLTGLATNLTSRGQYAKAVAMLNDLPDSIHRDSALHNLGGSWSADKPSAVASWLNQQPASTDRDLVVSGMVGTLVPTDPQAAVQWAASITDQQIQTFAFKQIAHSWLHLDAQAARSWLQSTNLPASEKETILRDFNDGKYPSFDFRLTNRR